MADKFSSLYISDVYGMVKIDRTFKFLVILGIIIFIDAIFNTTLIFNETIQTILSIFNLKIKNIGIYTSLYASIAVLLSSSLDRKKKLLCSIGLFILYIVIFTFITAYRIIYPSPSYSLYPTIIIFITTTFPILLWFLTGDKNKEQNGQKRNDSKKRKGFKHR